MVTNITHKKIKLVKIVFINANFGEDVYTEVLSHRTD